MTELEKILFVFIIVLAGIIALATYGHDKLKKEFKQFKIEAIKSGAAEWTVFEDGKTEFSWKHLQDKQ